MLRSKFILIQLTTAAQAPVDIVYMTSWPRTFSGSFFSWNITSTKKLHTGLFLFEFRLSIILHTPCVLDFVSGDLHVLSRNILHTPCVLDFVSHDLHALSRHIVFFSPSHTGTVLTFTYCPHASSKHQVPLQHRIPQIFCWKTVETNVAELCAPLNFREVQQLWLNYLAPRQEEAISG